MWSKVKKGSYSFFLAIEEDFNNILVQIKIYRIQITVVIRDYWDLATLLCSWQLLNNDQ